MSRLEFRIGIVVGIACGLLAAIHLTGCSEEYGFVVRGTVRNSADGKPLAGVMVWLPPALGTSAPIFTGDDGRFSFGWHGWDSRFGPDSKDGWLLTLTRDGLAEVVDINPGEMSEWGKEQTHIVVVASMRVNP